MAGPVRVNDEKNLKMRRLCGDSGHDPQVWSAGTVQTLASASLGWLRLAANITSAVCRCAGSCGAVSRSGGFSAELGGAGLPAVSGQRPRQRAATVRDGKM